MYCRNCGTQLPDWSKFCGSCGQATGVTSNNNIPMNIPVINKKKKSRKWPLVIVALFVCLTLEGVITIGYPYIKNLLQNKEDEFYYSKKLPDELVFDDSELTTLPGEPEEIPVVNAISPSAGPIGQKVAITGDHLISHTIQTVMLNDLELIFYSGSPDSIEVIIPYGASDGLIIIVYDNATIDAGEFVVEPYDKVLMTEQVLTVSSIPQIVNGDGIDIMVPAGAITQEESLTIQVINNPSLFNLPDSAISDAFSISIGDVHQFSDTLYIDYTLPRQLPGEPSAAYFNEESSTWDNLPSEIIDGKLRIYTDHLTDFIIYYWGKAIYSSEGYFKIYYQESATHSYGSSMDDLAYIIGEILEEARKDFNVLPEAYREDFSYLGFKDSMDVYIDSSRGDATYNPMTNNILLPTDFTDIDDLETTVAHELFHAYQDTVWNEFKVIGKMGKTENKWAVEALAELAAYELAFPEKNRERLLVKDVNSQNPFATVDNDHEYNMSCFLKYLLTVTDTNYKDLWIYVVDSQKSTIEVSIDDFFKSRSSDYISLDMAYMDFWRAVLSDSNAPSLTRPEIQFSKRKMYFLANQHKTSFKYTGVTSTIAFNLFASRTFSENMPTRIFSVNTLDQADYRVLCAKLSGLVNPKDINKYRVPDGYNWDLLYSDESLGDTHLLYTLEQGKDDMVLIALESIIGGNTYGVNIAEIQGQCLPLTLDKVIPDKEQEYTIAFKDIFDYVKEMELVIDFGDGTIKNFSKINDAGTFSGTIKHTFGDDITGEAVTISLYDMTQGKKEFISKMIIPITTAEAVTLTASPTTIFEKENIDFNTNILETDYTYHWSFGDGSSQETIGVSYINHTYNTPGIYTAKVSIKDSDGVAYGESTVVITVDPLEEEVIDDGTDNSGNSDSVDDTTDTEDTYNGKLITELEIGDLGGRWYGTAIPKSFGNLENFTTNGEKLTSEMVGHYLSVIEKEVDFMLEVDRIYDTLSVDISHHFDNEFSFWKHDYSNTPVMIQGQLSGTEDIKDMYKSDIRGTVSLNEDGKLKIEGTVDVVDYVTHWGEGDKYYEISYSYTFTAVKENYQ